MSFVIIASAFLLAREKIISEEKTIKLLTALFDSLERMISMLRFQSADVYSICERAFELEEFKRISDSFSESWVNACQKTLKSLSEDEYSLFESIGGFLGQFDLETQLSRLEYIKMEYIKRLDFRKSELSKKKKLYYSLGAFAGTIICLILI